ncbi:MAG: hypothetical protein VX987_07930 [Pseudomonadota bacterium]|nr:hypothetical protein [Pseudomonadota bacterium]
MHQSMAIQAGLYESYHGCEAEKTKKCIVVPRATFPESMDEFFKVNGETMAATKHITKSTQIKFRATDQCLN